MTFAKELKAWRLNLGWTQARAAKWLNAEPRTYEDWEYGRHKPSSLGPVRKLMGKARKPKPLDEDHPQLSLGDEGEVR